MPGKVPMNYFYHDEQSFSFALTQNDLDYTAFDLSGKLPREWRKRYRKEFSDPQGWLHE